MRKHKIIQFVAVVAGLVIIFMSADIIALVETGGIGIKVAQLYDYTNNATDHRGSASVGANAS